MISKGEIEGVSRLLSGSTSEQHRNGIIIGHSLGLKPIDMVLLFLENKQGWVFYIGEGSIANMIECKKTLCGNEFSMNYLFYYPKFSGRFTNKYSFETFLNKDLLKNSIQLPNGIKRKSTPMGKLVQQLLKLINREVKHCQKHSVY